MPVKEGERGRERWCVQFLSSVTRSAGAFNLKDPRIELLQRCVSRNPRVPNSARSELGNQRLASRIERNSSTLKKLPYYAQYNAYSANRNTSQAFKGPCRHRYPHSRAATRVSRSVGSLLGVRLRWPRRARNFRCKFLGKPTWSL